MKLAEKLNSELDKEADHNNLLTPKENSNTLLDSASSKRLDLAFTNPKHKFERERMAKSNLDTPVFKTLERKKFTGSMKDFQ